MTAEWGTNGYWEGFEDYTIGKWIGEDSSRWINAWWWSEWDIFGRRL